jgi:hypothetical protein
MTQSPLQFAREFERLKSDLRTQPAPDLQLLQLSDFWTTHSALFRDTNYRSYLDEFQPLLLHLITDSTLFDMTLDELQRVRKALSELGQRAEIADKLGLVTNRLAQLFSYVGEHKQAEALLSTAPPTGDKTFVGRVPSEAKRSAEPDKDPPLSSPRRRGSSDRAEDNQALDSRLRGNDTPPEGAPPLAVGSTDTIFHDRATCLFVERDDSGRTARGRMRTLIGRVELSGKSTPTDEITFANQIKTPDDPFIGVAYDSLDALRQVFKTQGMKNQASSYYHAHFQIENSEHTFTGDSIGLALSLIAYTQLLQPEMLRLDRFLSSEVAFTGGVEKSGRVSPVSEETLSLKIERAFFSPVKYLALPDSNLDSARRHLEKLKGTYPHRHLALIPVERLTDALDDHNVVRSEKICIGEFVAKRAYKYTRTAKVQIPLLVVLMYLAVCLVYPKAWVGFDWNPAKFRVSEDEIRVLNVSNQFLWKVSFGCRIKPDTNEPSQWSSYQARDLNGDGVNEVLIMPVVARDSISMNRLFVYSAYGETLFVRDCAIVGQYPGDSPRMVLESPLLSVDTANGFMFIVTHLFWTGPAHQFIKIWDLKGNLKGWYINSGAANYYYAYDVNGDGKKELVFRAYANRMSSCGIFALPADSASGVSPPYEVVNGLDLSSVRRGNQIHYMLFPQTDVSKVERPETNNECSEPAYVRDGTFRVMTCEYRGLGDVYYTLDRRFRVIGAFGSDWFRQHRIELVMAGKLPPIGTGAYNRKLELSVTYWTPSGWMTEGELRTQVK